MRAVSTKTRLQRRVRKNSRERGVAMVMVLLSIVVLTVYATEVQQESSTTLASAISARERLKAEYAARSAVNLSRMLIATEPTIRAAVEPMFMMLNNGKGKAPQIPVWEFVDQVLGSYNCPGKAQGFADLAGVDNSTGENLGLGEKTCFDIVVVDEDARINVNTAARGDSISLTRIAGQLMTLMSGQQYDPLFENLDPDGQHSDRATICGSLIDWADSDQNLESCNLDAQASTAGAEDNFYQSIGLPYFRKNAAFDSLEELRLVRGVSDDWWATFVDPKPEDPRKRNVTVWGQGKVNINSANAMTLWTITCVNAVEGTPLCADPLQVAAFLQMVSLAKTFTAGAPLFSSASDFVNTMKGKGMIGPQLASLGVEPVVFKSEKELKDQLTTKSKMFSIYAEGSVAGRNRDTRVNIHAVVDFRNATDINQASAGGLFGTDPTTGAKDGEGESAQPVGPSGTTGSVEELLAALNSNPAGNMIYWRVQ